MTIKILLTFSYILILAFFNKFETLAENEVELQKVRNSCHNNSLKSNDERDYKINEVINENLNKIDLSNVYSKINKSEVDFSKSNNNSYVNNSRIHVTCILNKTYSGQHVELVNATKLTLLLHVEPNVTSRQIPGNCVAVLFYSPSCPFSCMAAPHFNALSKNFPDIKMVAIDAMKYRNFNAQFGIMGTPTLMLFHSGRPAAKFNETSDYSLEVFANFITKYTGIKPEGKLVVTSADFGGPVSSTLVNETDYYLLLSWLVIGARILYSFYYSTWGKSLMDATLNAWREAEAQHHHVD